MNEADKSFWAGVIITFIVMLFAVGFTIVDTNQSWRQQIADHGCAEFYFGPKARQAMEMEKPMSFNISQEKYQNGTTYSTVRWFDVTLDSYVEENDGFRITGTTRKIYPNLESCILAMAKTRVSKSKRDLALWQSILIEAKKKQL